MIFVSPQQTIVNDDLKRAMLNIDTQEALVEFIVYIQWTWIYTTNPIFKARKHAFSSSYKQTDDN